MTIHLRTVRTRERRRQISGTRTMRVDRPLTMELMAALTGHLTGRMMRHLRRIKDGRAIILRLRRLRVGAEIVTVTGMENHTTTCTPRLELL